MNVAALLSQRAAQTPERLAIVDCTKRVPRTLTYAQLDAAAAGAATAFAHSGLRPGDRVLVLHSMTASLYVALAGMLRAGLVPVFCDPGAGRSHFGRACASVSPNAIFASPAGHAYTTTIPACARIARITSIAAPGLAHPVLERSQDDPALITFTSGSTGVPKAIVRTHGLLWAQLSAIRATLPLDGVDVATMPIVLLANLAAGITSVIPGVNLRRPGKANPKRLARDIAQTGATSITASPAMIEGLLRVPPEQLRTLRRVVTGGGPVMPALMGALARKLPHAQIIGVYGSSEAEPIACVSYDGIEPGDLAAMRSGAGLLVGRPATHAQVRIIDGEIAVSGDHVVPGYLGGIGDEETKLRIDGRVWHRTGDGGYFDERGRLWLTGRVQSVIRDERGVIEPFRVECALSFEPGVARSAVVVERGLRTVFVEMGDAAVDLKQLREALSWAHVDAVHFIATVPVDRRHNAKVDYVALRKLVRA